MHKILDFKKEYIEDFRFREEDIDTLVDAGIDGPEFLDTCYSNPTKVIFSGDIPITIIGCISIWNGVGNIWQMPIVDIDKYIRDFLRGCRDLRDSFMESGYHRLQTTCPAESRFNKWMIKGMGFTQECVLKAYGPDKLDHVLYSKVVM